MLQRLVGDSIDLKVLLDPELGSVRSDPGQIQQVLLNLVLNARDAMPEGGKLTIQTISSKSPVPLELKPAGLAEGRYSIISISDNGSGIAADVQPRIFEPFFTTKANGTGLGLSTVIILSSRTTAAFIWRANPAKGTTFQVYLPVTDAPVAIHDHILSVTAGQPDETILIVEDDDSVRKVISEVLKAAGYSITTAKLGHEAVRQVYHPELLPNWRSSIWCYPIPMAVMLENNWLASLQKPSSPT
jgi:hypothetical protein